MKFNPVILRITFFWTAFALSAFAVSMFSSKMSCTASHIPEAVETAPPVRAAAENIPEVDAEEYAVFSAVLRQMRLFETVVVSEIAVDANQNDSIWLHRRSLNVTDTTINNYLSKNLEMRKLRGAFDPAARITLLSPQEENRLFPKDETGWDGFYRAYPNARGIFYFSSVGFNKYRDEAIVRVKFQSAYWGTANEFYVLRKIDDAWLVETDSRGSYVE